MRFEVLTGLRGLLLLWVMFVHLPSSAVPSFMTWPHSSWRFGVDFFLAISGFLVTRSLLGGGDTVPKGDRLPAVRQYLIRRVARIFPAYYVMLGIIVATAFVFRGGLLDGLKNVSEILPSFPFFFANYFIPTHFHDLPHMLIITWSLSFQEQFYFILALFFLWGGSRMGYWLAAASIASIVMRFAMAFGPWDGLDRRFYYEAWTHLNFDSIGWGCVAWLVRGKLHFLWSTRARAWATNAGILALIAAVIVVPGLVASDKIFVLNATIKAMAFALAIVAASELETSKGLFAKFLKSGFMSRLGNASFEIYLIHVYVYGFVLKVGPKVGIQGGPIELLLLYGVAIVAGILFYDRFSLGMQDRVKTWLRGSSRKTPRPLAAS